MTFNLGENDAFAFLAALFVSDWFFDLVMRPRLGKIFGPDGTKFGRGVAIWLGVFATTLVAAFFLLRAAINLIGVRAQIMTLVITILSISFVVQGIKTVRAFRSAQKPK